MESPFTMWSDVAGMHEATMGHKHYVSFTMPFSI